MTEEGQQLLEQRLIVAFDGADWAMRSWIRRNCGPDVAHELPGQVAPFRHVCHEAADALARRGKVEETLELLEKNKGWGGLRIETMAASRYAPIVVVVVLVVLGMHLAVELVVAGAVAACLMGCLAYEVWRLVKRRRVTGTKVTGARPLGLGSALSGIFVALLWLSDTPGQAAPAPAPTPQKVKAVESREDSGGNPGRRITSPARTPFPATPTSKQYTPECMADALRTQAERGWVLDVVEWRPRSTLKPGGSTSAIDLHKYDGHTVTLTVCSIVLVSAQTLKQQDQLPALILGIGRVRQKTYFGIGNDREPKGTEILAYPRTSSAEFFITPQLASSYPFLESPLSDKIVPISSPKPNRLFGRREDYEGPTHFNDIYALTVH